MTRFFFAYLVTLLLLSELMSVYGAFALGCNKPEVYIGRSWCDHWGKLCGECVSFIKRCTGSRAITRQWRRGALVRDTEAHPGRPTYGTAVATFPRSNGGRYSGHTAIYVDQNEDGMWVYDQWKGVDVQRRFIRWNDGTLGGSANNYYIVYVN